ncbi:hypothetical protein [Nitrosomonas sp.]|uniref:hypothetical protein n=1 Tax=Nitrosomonas sp. TaxID=42353 RepID=UPI00208C40D4|nr:hypothetical protein [Nitrosomonas sp.]GJL76468.1 MAG: hypothetical protein NMNS02_25740 [Nitrosomonas sp.]
MQYPRREGLEYFISVYLPGFLTAIVLISAAAHDKWIHNILLPPDNVSTDSSNTSAKEQNEEKNDVNDTSDNSLTDEKNKKPEKLNTKLINNSLTLAFFAFYFIVGQYLPLIRATFAAKSNL